VGRHGEGYHNVAESFYGTEAWDVRRHSHPRHSLSNRLQCYWSLKDGNGTISWADAHLTSAGIAQAQKANAFWSSQISTQHIPTPESYYSSPLTRCLDTANLTFSNLPLPATHPFIPTIKELFREVIGVHTCDRRSSKTFIGERYPEWKFEEGFKEEDPLWSATDRESDGAMDERSRKVLDDVFENDGNAWISISSHSGEIGSLLRGECFFLFADGEEMLIWDSAGTSKVWFGDWAGHSCACEGGGC
jgi:broad specificity phosphatase PhoE